MNDSIQFLGRVERALYEGDEYKFYALALDRRKYPYVKVGRYGTATITGDFESLALGTEYAVTAVEESSKYGPNYRVSNIRREKPTSPEATRTFLQEILTHNQAKTLTSVYPNVVDMVMQGKAAEVDLSKTPGIKQKTFEGICKKIIANFKLSEMVEEFGGVFPISVLKKLYDKYPSVTKIKQLLRQDPYGCLCRVSGIGFKTADSMLLTLWRDCKQKLSMGQMPVLHFTEELPSSRGRCLAAARYALSNNEEDGNTYMEAAPFKREVATLAPQAAGHITAVLKAEEINFDTTRLRVARHTTAMAERQIATILKHAAACKTLWQQDVTAFRQLDGFTLTDAQLSVLTTMCGHNAACLIGYGGSGKSACTKALVNLMEAMGKSYLLLAPTGRAAKVLAGYTGRPAYTVHRGLGYRPPNTWRYGQAMQLEVDAVLLDESSMVDVPLFLQLLQSIDFTRTKLLIIGDDAQLPSVGPGNVLHDIIHSGLLPLIKLETIFRYGKGGLATAATDAREGRLYLDENNKGAQVLGEDGSFTFLPIDGTALNKAVVALYQKLLAGGNTVSDIMVLTSYNVGPYGTIALCKALQNAINQGAESLAYGDGEYRVADNVMQTVNDYNPNVLECSTVCLDVPNGEIGQVNSIEGRGLHIRFEDSLVAYPRDKLNQLQLAYAISVHKSQGGQFPVVLLVTPSAHSYFLNANILYVGLSRAQKRCYQLGSLKAIKRAVGIKANHNRKTLLLDFLKEEPTNEMQHKIAG